MKCINNLFSCSYSSPVESKHTTLRSEKTTTVDSYTRTAAYYTFFPATITDWNNLSLDALPARSVPCFKTLLQQTDGIKTNHVYSLGHGY